MRTVNSLGSKFSLAAVGLLLPCDRPLLVTDTSKPPRPLLVTLVVVVMATVELAGFVPKSPPVVVPKRGGAGI